MKVYLVGGAVRDKRLGRVIKDEDFVVVGASPEQMLSLGYQAVGKDFPVFLHPQTKSEYALARTERKTAPGYQGFAFSTDKNITLEQDLARRDLTINAMAETLDGELIDPYGGAADLDARILRHVGNAFVEDPVRILRVARFAARYAALGFRVADETMQLMQQMVSQGEVDHLVSERVWQEIRGALAEPKPSAMLRVLRECGALKILLPEVDALYGVPQRAEFHPEIDTGIHTEMVLDMAAKIAPGDDLVAYCALVHDLGKALTPPEVLPKHINHEHAGIALVQAVNARLKVPSEHAKMARVVCEKHLQVHMAMEIRPGTILELFESLDSFRKPARLDILLQACEADKRGRLNLQDEPYPQAHFLSQCFAAARNIDAKQFVEQGMQGEAIANAIRHARLQSITRARKF